MCVEVSAASEGGTRLLSDGAATDLSVPEKLFLCRPDVFDDLPKKQRGYIASGVNRDGSASTIRMSELLVGPTLSHFFEPHLLEDRDDLS